MARPIDLGIRSNPGRVGAAGAARLINCYPEEIGPEGKIPYPVYACDGFTAFATIPSGGLTRALLALDSASAYGVSGNQLVKVTSAGVVTSLATFPTTGVVTMARNRKEPNPDIAVVSSDGLFRRILADVVTTPTLPSGVVFNSVCTLDGYFIFTLANGEFYISAIDDTAIDELDFAKAEASPDGLVLGLAKGRDLCLFGERSTEFWTNTGGADFPFERVSSHSTGLYAAGAAKKIGMVAGDTPLDTIMYPATDAEGAYIGIYFLNGYTPQRVSTPPVDRAVISEPNAANLKACVWSSGDHVFYAISGTSFTWVYDTVTGVWHERTSASLLRWRISEACQFGSRLIVGDYTNGQLYTMNKSQTVAADSVVTLSQSKNNGESFGEARSKTIGGSTALTQRFKWNRLGSSTEDGKVFKIEITNAVAENGTGVSMQIIPPHVHAYPNRMRATALYVDVIPGSSQNARPKGVTGLSIDDYVVGT